MPTTEIKVEVKRSERPVTLTMNRLLFLGGEENEFRAAFQSLLVGRCESVNIAAPSGRIFINLALLEPELNVV